MLALFLILCLLWLPAALQVTLLLDTSPLLTPLCRFASLFFRPPRGFLPSSSLAESSLDFAWVGFRILHRAVRPVLCLGSTPGIIITPQSVHAAESRSLAAILLPP